MKTVFQLLDLDPPCLLIGGFAMQKYGLDRQTMDVDVLAASSQLDQLEETLKEAGYETIASADTFRRYRTDNIYLMDVDAILVDKPTFDALLAESRVLELDNTRLRVPSLKHLIALKIHAVSNNPDRAAKDLLDVAELIKLNPKAISQEELNRISEKYGTPESAAKLKGML